MEVILEPNPSCCIETFAKKEYKRLLSLIMNNSQEDSQLLERLELLRIFLESADFRKLRSRCDKFLHNGRRMEVRLKSTTKAPAYEIEIGEVL